MIEALKLDKDIAYVFEGIGGPHMEAAGHFQSLFPYQQLAVMGGDIVRHFPTLLRRFRQTCLTVEASQPDLLITIDSPEFSLRVAKKVRLSTGRKIHIVAPSVWAWRAGRAKKIAQFLDGLGCFLPFEPHLFEREGLKACYLGHPFLEKIQRANVLLSEEKAFSPPHLLLMPGSRRREVETLLPLFRQVVERIWFQTPEVEVSLLTLPHLKPRAVSLLGGIKERVKVVTDHRGSLTLMRKSTAALVASGTATLELGLCGCPMVVAYQVSPFLGILVRRLIKTPFVSLPNIILQCSAVPELLQKDCTVERLVASIQPLLAPTRARQQQKDLLQKLTTSMHPQRSFGENIRNLVKGTTSL
jgi:lipid-A-disaccharide synthase